MKYMYNRLQLVFFILLVVLILPVSSVASDTVAELSGVTNATNELSSLVGNSDSVNSCVGNCDQQAPSGCHCDAACVNFGDCCADYEASCVNGGDGDGDINPGGEFDRAGNLVGFLCASQAESNLFVVNGHEAQVLGSLNAIQAGPNEYFLQQVAPDGIIIELLFSMEVVNNLGAIAAGDAKDDPVLVCENGKYKTYKNAKCAFLDQWPPVGCGPYLNNESATVDYNARHKCQSGVDYCTEVNQVWWTRKVYDDAACKVLLRTDHGKDFLCKP